MSLIEYGLLLPGLPRPSWVIMPYFRFLSFLIVYPGRIQWGTPRVQWFIDWFIDCFSRLLHPPRCYFFTYVYLSPHINLFNKEPEEPAEAKVWSGETPSFILWMIYFCLWLHSPHFFTTHHSSNWCKGHLLPASLWAYTSSMDFSAPWFMSQIISSGAPCYRPCFGQRHGE